MLRFTKLDRDLTYRLNRSRRKTLTLIMHDDQSLEVRSPHHITKGEIDRFVMAKADWIRKKRSETGQADLIGPLPSQQIKTLMPAFADLIQQAIQSFDGPRPQRVRVRDLSSRWGSCSSRGSISLNSRLLILPRDLQRYVIYHELCHLVHMNHSARFWQLLACYVPEPRQQRQHLNRQFRLQSR